MQHAALPCCRAPPARAAFAPRRRRAPAPALRPPAAAAADGAPEPRALSDSLAALDRLCGAPDQAPDECATAELAPPSAEPVVRSVELTLPGDDGAPRPVSVSFRLAGASSRLLVAPLSLPLGLVFEESSLGCELVEILPDGSAAAAAADAASAVPRLQPGDTLRAATACVTAMEYSAGNLLGGGVGRPRTRVVVLRVDEVQAWSDASFGRALAGIQSNARAGRREVTLVLERRPAGADDAAANT
jgi:hypothetical protein